MRRLYGLLKLNPLAPDLEKHFGLLLMQCRSHLILKRCYLIQQSANTIIHEAPDR